MYTIDKLKVTYSNKKIKADAESFERLDQGFARDKDGVFYKGKRQSKLDPLSLRILSPSFVSDDSCVWFVTERTIKPTKASPSSFVALGFAYGKDQQTGFYMDKAIRGSDPATLRPLTDGVAMDSNSVYASNRSVLKASLDPSSAQAHRDGTDIFIWDAQGVWYSVHDWKAKALPEADASKFRVLSKCYASDLQRLYYGQDIVEGVDPNLVEVRDEELELLVAGDTVVWKGKVLEDCDPGTLGYFGDFLFDHKGVFHAQTPFARFAEVESPDPEECLSQAIAYHYRLVSGCYPIGSRPQDDELPQVAPPPFQVSLEGCRVLLESGALSLSGSLDNLWTLASQLWTHKQYGECFLRFIHQTGVSYPEGDFQQRRGLKHSGPELLALARKHCQESLTSLTRMAERSISWQNLAPYLSASNHQALQANSYRRNPSKVTTNLARARELLKLGALGSESALERFQTASELYGLAQETDKVSLFLKDLAPAISQQCQQEECASIRLQWLSVLDMLMARVITKADMGGEALYEQARPYLERLLEERFNLDLNLARLLEAQRFLGENSSETEERLRELVGPNRMSAIWSGLHTDYPNLSMWLWSSEVRVLKHKSPAEKKRVLANLRVRFEADIVEWNSPYVVGDLLCDLEDIAQSVGDHTWDLTWDQAHYTRMSRVQYLMEEMSYTIQGFKTDDQGFWLEGWPLGRRVEAKVGGESLPAYLGMRSPWPDGKPGPVEYS